MSGRPGQPARGGERGGVARVRPEVQSRLRAVGNASALRPPAKDLHLQELPLPLLPLFRIDPAGAARRHHSLQSFAHNPNCAQQYFSIFVDSLRLEIFNFVFV